jgi:hypothetical protein
MEKELRKSEWTFFFWERGEVSIHRGLYEERFESLNKALVKILEMEYNA